MGCAETKVATWDDLAFKLITFGWNDEINIHKPKNPKPSAKEHPAKDDTCQHCKEVGHSKRNCPVYLAELLKKKKQVGSASSSVICLDNCHYAPSITRGVVLVHRLVENGFVQCFIDFRISVSKNNVHYFNAIPNNGIYEINMHDLVPNVNSIYNVSTKRAKHNLDSTYLWHCRLAHISKKRIEKLQQEGLLKSIDDESFDQCVSCLSGKMTRKSFPHHPERATDLLGIIHTDVCGPLRHVSRQGASYFIRLTDDYSRYGYVYLLKHKHEVFKTFKVFKNEVENQLEKTINALRSDRGGEYISHEFKDYLKAGGIVQQLTPPYTPQHNGVSKRRDRTLLDMVRSMMNLTTLPLSFWDYALESATRILNMVPTKKVDKTPYELWYGKVPNLSYLKVWGCEALVKRDTPDKLQQRSVKCIFIRYPKETMGYYFYFPLENKIVVARYAEFFEKNLITQEVSGRAIDLEEIQDEDTSPSEITSKIPMEVEGFEPPQEEEILIRRSNLSSSDDKSFLDEDIPKENYSNPLFDEEIISTKIDLHQFNVESDLIESLLNRNTLIISSPKFDSLLEEFFGELAHIDLIPPGINEADFDPEKDIRLVERFFNDSPSLLENESFHFVVPSSPRPLAKPPDDGIYFEPDTGIFTKVVDDISDNSTRELYVHVPNVLPILSTLYSMFDTLLPFSSENEDKVYLLSHRGVNPSKIISDFSESPMMIYGGNIPNLDVLFLHFYPP
ncbi:retrotransposon protein, putative, ty1-copia subclass [Tanacetum coccineum]